MATSRSELAASALSETHKRGPRIDFRPRFGVPVLLFTLGYALLFAWFHGIDVYHRHFSEDGLIVFVYNCSRILFIVYLFCLIMAAGLFLLGAVARPELEQTDALERVALSFFAGAGVWHVAMFGLGYLDLYTVPVALIVTLPMIALAYAPSHATVADIYRSLRNRKPVHDVGPAKVHIALLGFAAAVFALLLIMKGLYPGGSHDYFTHYFYYFQSVVARGNLWPNEVWYHYYYDKGAGLDFLAILLSDPLAPQLVTFCFIAAAALVTFIASRDAAPGTYWPWLSLILFLIIYLYTPGWGEFEKSHELTTSLVIAALWTASRSFARCGESQNRLWPAAAGSIIVGTVIVTPTIAVFLGGIFVAMSGWYLITRQRHRAGMSLVFASITGFILAGIFAINYGTTGLITDQLLLATWSISDIEKLHRWGALPMTIQQYWGLVGMEADKLKLLAVPKLIVQAARLDLIYPFAEAAALIGASTAVFRLRHGRWPGLPNVPHQTGILLASLPVFIGIALTAGRVQPISFYRYTGFAVPLVLVAATGLWNVPLAQPEGRLARLINHRYTPIVVLAACLITFMHATPPARFFRILPNSLRYAIGAYSIDTAYTRQPDTGLFPVNAIYPGARGAYGIVGPGTPIWSMHYLSYCMLPDCRIESMYSFILPGWYDVMFGTAEQARNTLQKAGLDYFLFSRELPLEDTLPLSRLFSPDSISQYLGLRWTDGTTSLLTWLGPGVTPLTPAWLADYRNSIAESQTVRSYPYAAMKQIFARLNATPHPWRPFPLPW